MSAYAYLTIGANTFYAGSATGLDSSARPLLVGTGRIRRPLDGETSNLVVQLSNKAGELAKLYARAPIGEQATLIVNRGDGEETAFEGVIWEFQLTRERASLRIVL